MRLYKISLILEQKSHLGTEGNEGNAKKFDYINLAEICDASAATCILTWQPLRDLAHRPDSVSGGM